MKKRKIARLPIVVLTICILATTACVDSTNSVSLRGYNHMKVLAISAFTVNGAIGPNVDTESGGGETCCVNIPKQWRPGLKARVSWSYDQNDDAEGPLPASQTAEVDIPEYRFVGAVQVHFYDEHKIKIIVSTCHPEHPFYPLNVVDLAPWQPSGTKAEAREIAQRGGGSIDC
jgi:hypothetical protein